MALGRARFLRAQMPRQDVYGRWISDDGALYWDGRAWQPVTPVTYQPTQPAAAAPRHPKSRNGRRPARARPPARDRDPGAGGAARRRGAGARRRGRGLSLRPSLHEGRLADTAAGGPWARGIGGGGGRGPGREVS